MQSSLFIILLCLSSLASAALTLNDISIKLGTFTLANKIQRISSSTITFDETSRSVFSIEYERSMTNNLKWGVEFITYKNDFSAGTSNALATHLALNMKNYFDVSQNVRPYIGAGITAAGVRLGGFSSGSAGSLGVQFMGGIKFPFENVAGVIEYKIISAEPTDFYGSSVNTSGSGLFAGISVDF